jgi:transposase-like protein
MKTAWRRTIIQVPRDRESSLSPLLIKKRESSAEGLENIIISFDFPAEIRKIIYNTNLIGNLNVKIRKYTIN